VTRTDAVTADDLTGWLSTHLAARFDDWEEEVEDGAETTVMTLDEVLADDGDLLRRTHRRMVGDGTPAAAAATYLADWYAGTIAGAVGYGLATAGAGPLVDGDPAALRFHVHPDGWPFRLELPARAVVASGHPWAGDAGIETTADVAEVVRRSVDALIDACAPIIEVCRPLASVGRAGLWNEVGDSLGTAVAHQHRFPVTEDMLDVLRRAVDHPGAPWRARPDLGFAESAVLGSIHVVRKGGCCLAYTNERSPRDPDDPAFDDDLRAYLRRFPDPVDEPRYCTTCSFRTIDDATARQVFWRERRTEQPPSSTTHEGET
jgi:hypothetical protein